MAAVQSPGTPKPADPSAARSTKADVEVIALSRDKWRWMSERNVDSLAALFHDEAVFVHMGYVRQNGGWKLGSLSFTRLLTP
jgi:hypothetical protein